MRPVICALVVKEMKIGWMAPHTNRQLKSRHSPLPQPLEGLWRPGLDSHDQRSGCCHDRHHEGGDNHGTDDGGGRIFEHSIGGDDR